MTFISICIPAYKRIQFIDRLLASIKNQNFKDFEVIVSDDSPGEEVRELCMKYENSFKIIYHKNLQALGTPENWNEAIRKSKGEWIKLMHDDDWFADANSLQLFANAALVSSSKFIFAAYRNIFLAENREEVVTISPLRKWLLKNNSATLLSKNVIGPPSVCMHRNDGRFWYDKKTKWVVDIDFYIQRLAVESFHYIDEFCVSVGISEDHVTQDCVRKPEVEIPENFYLLDKIGWSSLRNIAVYDAVWRLLRNLSMKNESDIVAAGYSGTLPDIIRSILTFHRQLPKACLEYGLLSKFFMSIHYIFNFKKA